MDEITVLLNITVALMVAFIGGIFMSRFTPGFVGDWETISQLIRLDKGGYQRVKATLNRKGA